MTSDADGGDGGPADAAPSSTEPGTVNDANTVPAAAADGVPGGDAAGAGLPETVLKATATKEPILAREVLAADAGDVRATTVSMERSGADHVTAERVIMSRSGAQRLEARSAQLDRSGAVRVSAERVVMQAGSAVAVVAAEARLVKSRALVVVSRSTTLDESARVLVHIGPDAPGVKPTLDTRGAATFGAAFAVVLFLLRTLLRRGR